MVDLDAVRTAERAAWGSYLLVMAVGADTARAKALWLSTVRVRAGMEPRGA